MTAKYDNEKDQYENKIRQLDAKLESLQSDLDNEMEKNIILSSEYDDFKQQQREEIENLKDIISDLKIQSSQTKRNNENNKDMEETETHDFTEPSEYSSNNIDHILSSQFNDSLTFNKPRKSSTSSVSDKIIRNSITMKSDNDKEKNENNNLNDSDVVDNLSSSMIQNSNNKRQFKYSPQIVDSVGYVKRKKKICYGCLGFKSPNSSADDSRSVSTNYTENSQFEDESQQLQHQQHDNEEELQEEQNKQEIEEEKEEEEKQPQIKKEIVVESQNLEVEETVMKSFVTPEKHQIRKPKEYFTPDNKRIVTLSENTPRRFKTKSPNVTDIDTSFGTPSTANEKSNIVTPMSVHSESSIPFSNFDNPSPSRPQQNPQFAVFIHVLTDPYINEEIEFLKVFNEEDEDGKAECYVKFFDTNKGVWNRYEYDDCFDIHSNQLLYNQIPTYIQQLCSGEDVNLMTFGFPHSEKNTLLFGTKYSWSGESTSGLSNSKLQNTISNHSIPFDLNFLSTLLSFKLNSGISTHVRLTGIQICNDEFYDLITNKKLRLRFSDKEVLLPNLKCLTIKKIEEYQKFLKIVTSNYNTHILPKSASYYLFTVYVPFMYNYDENEQEEKYIYSKFTIINCPTQDTSNPRILRSLTAVKEVLLAMKKKAKVIPYRSNKVTMLLKYFFTENSKINIMTFINNFDIALYDDMKSLVGFVNTLYMPLMDYLKYATPPRTKKNDKDDSVIESVKSSHVKPKYDKESKIPTRMSKKKNDKIKESNINDDIFNENEPAEEEQQQQKEKENNDSSKKESHIPAPKTKSSSSKKENYIPSWFSPPPKNPIKKQK